MRRPAGRLWRLVLSAAFDEFEGNAAGQRLRGDQADLDLVS